MSYPQYGQPQQQYPQQQYPQQQYPQQQMPQQGYYPPPVAQPQQQQYPPAPMAGAPTFNAPAPSFSGAPRIRDIGEGRLVLIFPRKIETVRDTAQGAAPGSTQERMTMDLVILDGQPFPFGGNPEKPGGRQHDKMCPIPARFDGVWDSHVALVNQCRPYAGKTGSMVLGRLGLGKENGQGNRAWILSPATPADEQIAAAFLVSGAVAQAPQPQPAMPSFPLDALPPVRQYASAPMPQYAPAQQYIGSPDPGAQYAPPPAAPMTPPAPPGFPDAVWQTLTPEQRAAFTQGPAQPPAQPPAAATPSGGGWPAGV